MRDILVIYVSNTPRRCDMETMMSLNRITVNACNYNRQIMHGFADHDCDVLALFDAVQESSNLEHYSIYDEDLIQYLYFHTNNLSIKYRILSHHIQKVTYRKIIVVSDALNLRNVLFTQVYAKHHGIKNVAIVTDLYRYFHKKGSFNIKSWLFVQLGNFIMHRFDGFMLLSESMIHEDFVINKPYFVSEGVFEPYLTQSNSIRNVAEKVAIYAGTIVPEYGVITLMKAFNELKPSKLKLHIYSSEQAYSELIEQLSEYVEFKGYLPREQLTSKLVNADLLINPRPLYHEFNQYSFPSKLIEYMASGVPTITTRIPSIPDSIKNTLNYFEGDDLVGLIQGLQRFISSDSETYITKAQNAKRFVLDKYSHVSIARQIIQLVD